MLALLLALFGGGPTEEIKAIREAAAAMPQAVVTPIFVSFLGVKGAVDPQAAPALDAALANLPLPPALRRQVAALPLDVKAEKVFNLALNHVSLRKKKLFLRSLNLEGRRLSYFDAHDLGWNQQQLDALFAHEPYFRQFNKPHERHVYAVRLDWFVRQATAGRLYYDLLFGVKVKTLGDIYKILGVQREYDSAGNLGFSGGRTEDSGVNRTRNRVIKRYGSVAAADGSAFETDDLAIDSKSGEDVHEAVDTRGFVHPDAHEAFGTLPNGLFWYAVADDKDNLLDAAADKVAQDNRKYVPAGQLKNCVGERPSFHSAVIENAHICMGCHGAGTRPYTCWVASRIQDEGIGFFAAKAPVRNAIEDFYDWISQARLMEQASKVYVAAIRECTTLEPLEAMNLFAVLRWQWDEELIDQRQAAAEINCTAREFVQMCESLEANTPDAPGWKLRFRLALFFLEVKGDKVSAQAVLGLNNVEFARFLTGKVPIALGSNGLKQLARGGRITRFQWETLGVYTEAAGTICYMQLAIKEATMEELLQRFQGGPVAVVKEVPVAAAAIVKAAPALPKVSLNETPPVIPPPPDPDLLPPAEAYQNAKPGDLLPVAAADKKHVERGADGKPRLLKRRVSGDWKDFAGWELLP